MRASFPSCGIRTIPSRLHTRDRKAAPNLCPEDRLFIRHTPLPDGSGYEFQIPGHDHLENQSANSELLNRPDGFACDVLFDCRNGRHHLGHQIACLEVTSVQDLLIPNQNTIRKDRKGAIIADPDIYTFIVVHNPTPCMYPHCEILACKNGKPSNKVSSGIKTTVRMRFAELAERNRSRMTTQHAEEFPMWDRDLRRNTLVAKWIARVDGLYSVCTSRFVRLWQWLSSRVSK